LLAEEVVVAEGWWRKRGAPGVADRGVTGRASLMRSELSPRGARYTELAAASLGGAVGGGV